MTWCSERFTQAKHERYPAACCRITLGSMMVRPSISDHCVIVMHTIESMIELVYIVLLSKIPPRGKWTTESIQKQKEKEGLVSGPNRLGNRHYLLRIKSQDSSREDMRSRML